MVEVATVEVTVEAVMAAVDSGAVKVVEATVVVVREVAARVAARVAAVRVVATEAEVTVVATEGVATEAAKAVVG